MSSKEGHPISRHSDGQASNPSHSDGTYHHGVHPSFERAYNRAEAPVEVHHHETEHDPAMTKREHAARRAAHVQRR
jgi:hypothetical protein